MAVRGLDDGDRPWLHQLLVAEWGLPVVTISGAYDPSTLPGFVAEDVGMKVGAVTYRLEEGGCEIVTLNSLREGRRVGTSLLEAVKEFADLENRRLWLTTTDDNINAIQFYRRRGMKMSALHRDFVEHVRRQKPNLDDHTPGGIRFRHAVEFSF